MQFDMLNTSSIASSRSLSILLVCIALAVIVWLLAKWTCRQDPREPPYIHPRIPFVGHLIGMMRYGAKYFEYINTKTQHPIFTLPILTMRNYIVLDASLAGVIQRNNKTLSFYSLIVEVTRRLIAFDANATRITFDNINGDSGPGGLMAAVHEMLRRHLGPGPALDAMTAVQMEAKGRMVQSEIPSKISENGTQVGVEVGLYAWLRHIFTLCNATAIYGPENIFAIHPELEAEFWDFEEGMLGLVIDVLPQLTARKAFYARKKVLEGLVEYVRTERYKIASPLIQERVQTNLAFGLGEQMAGHAELILMFGILGNAVPSSFWLVANIFSRPALLQRIRDEVESTITTDATDDGRRKCIISSKRIQKSCPLLYSCYRETLRDNSLLTSARLVMEDTLLAEKYLLLKGSVVQIAGGVLHHSPKIWGEGAEGFDPDRFLSPSEAKEGVQASPLPKGVPSAAFRAFGGGTVICPGRHFAQSELMTLAAVLTLGFDIENPDGTSLTLPEKDEERIPLAMVKPKIDPAVRITRRWGWENVDFVVGI